MTTKRRMVILSVVTAVVGGIAVLAWSINRIPAIVRDCYGQWATAELVINYHQKFGQFPTGWQQLEAIYGDGQGLHHGGMSFPEVRERMVVEFGRLPELEALALSTSSVAKWPEIIHTKSGQQSHYSGAEPNQMVYKYLRNLPRSVEPGAGR
jgi:hypothetical protein